jgi:predicted component of type VI protein secretion system
MIENDSVGAGNTESTGDMSSAQTQQEILDLDSVSSFKFQGETYTPSQLAEIQQGYQRYGEASKYIEEDQRYWANVEHDIEKVLKNPARADEFKQVYPERFHKILDKYLGSSQRSAQDSGETSHQLPREIGEKLTAYEQRLRQFEEKAYQADVAAASAKIDAILPNLLKKYELADQDKVLFEAEKLLNKGGKLTDAVWERLVREDHERVTSRADKFYQAKLKNQLNQGQKGKDMGAGGSTPGSAPVKPKTFAQAQEALIASLRERGLK